MTPPVQSSNSGRLQGDGLVRYFRGAYYNAITWRWYMVMLGLMVIVTFACSRIAMLNLLAFEFAAVIGLLVSHFTAILVIREFDNLRTTMEHRSPFTPGPHPRLVIWGVVLGSLAAAGWLMLVGLIGIVLLDMVFGIRNCDALTGLGFFLTIPTIGAFFAGSLGSYCSLTTRSRRWAGWLYVLILLIFTARIIFRIARGHTIGMHDPFIGALNIPLYDQEANLESGFLYSRLYLFICASLLIKLTALLADDRFQKYSFRNVFRNIGRPDVFLPEFQTVLMFGTIFVLGLYFQGPLGMEVTRNYLEHRLNGMIETEHFILRYPTGGEVEEDIERIAEEHEYYYWQIFNEIGVAPEGMIRAYIYPNRREKTFLTGVGSSVYAKPWTGEIHVEYDRNQIRALKHELVHVISAPMGIRFFGSSMLGAYGEGIAEGIHWDTGNHLTHHQWSAALREADDPYTDGPFFPRDTAPLQLLTRNFRSGGFYSGRIGMNYYLSASHTRWFIDTYGIEAYSKAYLRNDTELAIGMSQEDTAEAWMEYLDHVPLRDEEIASARLVFSPPKFTVTVCAHEVAQHERLAGEAAQKLDWSGAWDEYEILLDFSPGNIRYGYEQAKMQYYIEDFSEALERIGELRLWESADEAWQTYLSVLEGDIYARSGQPAIAGVKYQEAVSSAMSVGARENIYLRLAILDSPAMDEFLAAFREAEEVRWRFERARSIDPGWLPYYYLGTNLVGDRMYEEAAEMFLECLRLDPPHSFVRRNCLYYLGICAYRNEEYSLARRNFQDAGVIAADIFLEEHPNYDGFIPLDRLDTWSYSCSDWLERCDWREIWGGIQLSDGD